MKTNIIYLVILITLQIITAYNHDRNKESGKTRKEVDDENDLVIPHDRFCKNAFQKCENRWFCFRWPIKPFWCRCEKYLLHCCEQSFHVCLKKDEKSMDNYNSCKAHYIVCSKKEL